MGDISTSPRSTPLLFAAVASHRKEGCFTPYWQSVWSIWSGLNSLKHEEARLTLLQPLWTWLCDLKRPNGLLHRIICLYQQNPGYCRIRCLSHAVNVNDVFHMYGRCCCCQISPVTNKTKKTEWQLYCETGTPTRSQSVTHTHTIHAAVSVTHSQALNWGRGVWHKLICLSVMRLAVAPLQLQGGKMGAIQVGSIKKPENHLIYDTKRVFSVGLK